MKCFHTSAIGATSQHAVYATANLRTGDLTLVLPYPRPSRPYNKSEGLMNTRFLETFCHGRQTWGSFPRRQRAGLNVRPSKRCPAGFRLLETDLQVDLFDVNSTRHGINGGCGGNDPRQSAGHGWRRKRNFAPRSNHPVPILPPLRARVRSAGRCLSVVHILAVWTLIEEGGAQLSPTGRRTDRVEAHTKHRHWPFERGALGYSCCTTEDVTIETCVSADCRRWYGLVRPPEGCATKTVPSPMFVHQPAGYSHLPQFALTPIVLRF